MAVKRSESQRHWNTLKHQERGFKMKCIITTLTLLALLIPVSAFALDITGSYTTSEGNMTLQQSGDRVSGRYTQDNGEITGVIYDSTLEGFWIEDHSDRRCSKPKNGRYFWGRISYEFTPEGFSGTWGYCNDAPSRKWTGTRSGSTQSDSVSVDAEEIEGVWSSSEGDITFRQRGSKVTGRYTQDNGEIIGNMRGSKLDAYWIENHSDRRCSTAKNGRYFWGKLQLHFEGDRFSGKWGYCEDKPSRQWNGQRR